MKFVDTSWWVAWALPDDARHNDALAMSARLGDGERLLTTSLVVGETWTFLRYRDGHRTAVGFLDEVEDFGSVGKLTVHAVTTEEQPRVWRWLRRHNERPYSSVDATSFEVMRARRLREALTFVLRV
ncbi:MAG: type II toxin-antitoxin system VapC family toxin [Acidimicrobiaceae bacterium]|nr:type II toxin-antitoxin system VapC family toxin [Acidimicrobiaceae bacterium]MXZ53592.1 type II toxin-antitoxin system VapC family toxin [Acidimicrobiaceae bacterium]MYB87603.1 type II toxin-antitoxin system VapC family toxin [Acidimicrobiaceae bacterium]MYH94756.1 type II toxin-antitoxin system VapC family toxin [Acidimicrobiaceae bacterium]